MPGIIPDSARRRKAKLSRWTGPRGSASIVRMKNREVAELFNEIASILELKGENVFRVNAYRRAAQNIEGLARAIEEVAAEDKLAELPGVGEDLAGKIDEFLKTGKIKFLEGLRKETPPVLLEMLRIPGIGPKTAVRLHKELGIKTLDDLKKAAGEHRIRSLPKMKAKTEENIVKGLEFVSRSSGRIPIGVAYPIAQGIVAALEPLAAVKRISPAGSLRRWRETVGDIDILVASRDPVTVIKHFTGLDEVERVLAEGSTKASVITKERIQVDLRVVDEKSYGAALAYFTGSKEHNIRLREMAIKKGWKLSEYGVFEESGRQEKQIAGKTEEEIYKLLGLPFIPPELREDAGELEAAKKGELPELVTLDEIKGDLHCHSDYSDGAASMEEVARAAMRKGYKYILLTDHTKSLTVANGLSDERRSEQIGAIDKLNGKLRGFRILKGAEVDIMGDGSLDMSDELLERLDIVYGAIHSRFKMSRAEMTKRVITAMENPRMDILAHPTGRLLGARDAYEIDMDAVIKAAAKTGTAIEINAHPARLDLDAANCRKAAGLGVMIGLGTDMHVLGEFDYMIYGVGTARRGWLTRKDILNTLPARDLLTKIRKKPRRK
jgi:DNA polymerase (family 10)